MSLLPFSVTIACEATIVCGREDCDLIVTMAVDSPEEQALVQAEIDHCTEYLDEYDLDWDSGEGA